MSRASNGLASGQTRVWERMDGQKMLEESATNGEGSWTKRC
ncbi:hypothetical protein [Bartonella chomelii]|nr:hypothetical protein [Bartonella chomelii]